MTSTTLKQVAREAGVALSTASRAMTDHPNVDPTTRQRVLAAAARLGYQPNALARALRSRSTQSIGVVVPDILNPYYTACTAVLQDHFEQRGYGMVLAISGNDEARERAALKRFASAQVDGLVIVPTSRRWSWPGSRVPIVQMNRWSSNGDVDSVQIAESEGAKSLMKHLLSMGHLRVAVIIGGSRLSSTIDRIAGIRQALTGTGVSVADELIFSREYSRAWGSEAFHRLWQMHPRPTAVFSGSTELTVGVLTAVAELGARIPDDVSLVSFGDPGWFQITSPPLTCFVQPLKEIGLVTAQLLLDRIDTAKTSDPRTISIEGSMAVRKSVHQI